MNIKKLLGAGIVAGAVAFSSIGAAGAAISIDADGKGFVGKGDIQYTFGWSNKELQNNLADAVVDFTYVATVTTVSEVSWVCTNNRNENTQERERTTTTTRSTNGVVSAVARDNKKQITGVNLNGWKGTPVVNPGTTSAEGPAQDSCPNNWTLTTPAGAPVIDEEASSSTGGLFVSVNGGTATLLVEKPAV